MTWLASAIPGAVGSIASAFLGANAAGTAAQAAKKAAKQQTALSKEQLALAKDTFNQGQTTATEGYTRDAATVAQDRAAQTGIYQPYQAYGQSGIDSMSGLLGENPEAAAAFEARFKGSPVYDLNYQSMLDAGQRGVENQASSAGGLNSGAILKALQGNATDVTNRLLGEYVGYGNDRIGVGQTAAAGLSGAYGRNAAAGLGASGAYTQNRLTTGQNYNSNAGSAYGNLSNAYQARANAVGAGALGQAQAWGGGLAGAGQAFGQAYGQAQDPYGYYNRLMAPQNIVPRGY